jgi:hypothetical protein
MITLKDLKEALNKLDESWDDVEITVGYWDHDYFIYEGADLFTDTSPEGERYIQIDADGIGKE